MARLADAILKPKEAYGGHAGTINLRHGGQFGLMPRIGAIDYSGENHFAEIISTHAYVRKNVIPIVLDYPRGLNLMPDAYKWIDAYKNMIETIPTSIEGLTSGLTVETDEHPIGGAGEMLEEITDVKRARTTLSFSYRERAGKSINKFLDILIRYLYMDPDQKRPLVCRLFPGAGLEAVKGMYTPDYYTGTVLFIEPDTTTRVVVDAWLCTNMFFKSNGERTGRRAITQGGELVEHSIESSCVTMSNESVKRLADEILGSLNILNSTPDVDMHITHNAIDPALRNDPSIGGTNTSGFEEYQSPRGPDSIGGYRQDGTAMPGATVIPGI